MRWAGLQTPLWGGLGSRARWEGIDDGLHYLPRWRRRWGGARAQAGEAKLPEVITTRRLPQCPTRS